MSKKRTLKYKTIAKSEDAPVVGSVVEEKDTIFVKQITATEFEVYVSDETGYVVKLDKTIDKASFDAMVLEYINENSIDIKNTLNLAPGYFVFFVQEDDTDIIFYHNDRKREIFPYMIAQLESYGLRYYYKNNDRLEVSGDDYPNNYILVNHIGIVGRNITGKLSLLSNSEVSQFYFGKLNANNIVKDNVNFILSDSIKVESTISNNSGDQRLKVPIVLGNNTIYRIDGKMYLLVKDTGEKILKVSSQESEFYRDFVIGDKVIEINEDVSEINIELIDVEYVSKTLNVNIEDKLGIIGDSAEIVTYAGVSGFGEIIINEGANTIKVLSTENKFSIGIKATEGNYLPSLKLKVEANNDVIGEKVTHGYSEYIALEEQINIEEYTNIKVTISSPIEEVYS